jgi:hypothetical protein
MRVKSTVVAIAFSNSVTGCGASMTFKQCGTWRATAKGKKVISGAIYLYFRDLIEVNNASQRTIPPVKPDVQVMR